MLVDILHQKEIQVELQLQVVLWAEVEVEQVLLEQMLLLLLEEMVELDHLVHYQVRQQIMLEVEEVQEKHPQLEKQLVLEE
jgi:hypothetical protein